MSGAPLLAIDVAGLLLGAGVVVLAVSALATSVTLPTLHLSARRWSRRRTPDTPAVGPTSMPPIVATHRRVVTGRPVAYVPPVPAAIPLPSAPSASAGAPRPDRQAAAVPDGRVLSEVEQAVATIEHELDTDPERLARLMMDWIRSDAR